MRKRSQFWLAGSAVLILLAGVPAALWFCVTYEPSFYHERIAPVPKQHDVARQFVVQSLQLRNDIANEPRLGGGLHRRGSQCLAGRGPGDALRRFDPPRRPRTPRGLRARPCHPGLPARPGTDPLGRLGGVARCRARAEPAGLDGREDPRGALPVAPERFLDNIAAQAAGQNLDVRWTKEGTESVALIRYHPYLNRKDILLDRIQLLDGRIRLLGRSERQSQTALKLPGPRALQSTFPRRASQRSLTPGVTLRRSSSSPLRAEAWSRTTTRSSDQHSAL